LPSTSCVEIRANQAAEDLPALDCGGNVGDVAGPEQRRFLPQPLVRTMAVVVPHILGQHLAQVLLAEDQHVVQALAAKRAHEPFRECVAPHRQLHPIRSIGTDASG